MNELKLIYRDYDGPGTEELFHAFQEHLPLVGDSIIYGQQQAFTVAGRTFVYDGVGNLFAIVIYVTSKGISNDRLQSMQTGTTSR